jgi:hypothetical protein
LGDGMPCVIILLWMPPEVRVPHGNILKPKTLADRLRELSDRFGDWLAGLLPPPEPVPVPVPVRERRR